MNRRHSIFIGLLGLLSSLGVHYSYAASDAVGIALSLSPRVCTLASDDKQCSTSVHAQWRSPTPESLCLVIVGRPEIKHCWENYAEGTYSIDLVFDEDQIFQLRDLPLEHVLATAAVRVIKEAVRLRHRRRDPWNVFN